MVSREASNFVVLVLAFVLAIIVGFFLVIGRGLLLPIFAAVISVYVLTAAADAMGRLPFFRHLPFFVRRILVLIGFTMSFVALGLVVAVTVNQLIGLVPTYRHNLETILGQLADLVGFDEHPSWEQIREATIGRLDVGSLLTSVLGSVTNFGTTIFLVVVYAIFLVAERGTFAGKLMAAFPQGDSAERTSHLITDINRRIGEYLAVKTLVNVILGVASYAIMLIMGLDFALFWAVLIGLFNYIPYVGSLIAVFLPVGLSLAQFGSISTTLILAALLIVPQVYVGNFLEPRMLSKQLNLSPFVVLVALALWSAIWGLPGAILAIPMTSMIAIIFGAFPSTRFIAVLLSERVDEPTLSSPDPANR
ncbi:MAG: AI-2E family transporter [Bauldia sp.]|nr:AI-2E family transporter [Bauldia sp.]